MGNPFDAEDLTQDVFLSAYKNLSRFDGTYEKAWLSKIAVHKCLDHLKAAGRRTIPTEDTYFEQLHDKESSPEEAFLDKDFQNRVRHLCSDLKSPYREVATAPLISAKKKPPQRLQKHRTKIPKQSRRRFTVQDPC